MLERDDLRAEGPNSGKLTTQEMVPSTPSSGRYAHARATREAPAPVVYNIVDDDPAPMGERLPILAASPR